MFFLRFFVQNNYIVSLYSFLIRFRQFYFSTQIDDLAKAIAFAHTPFFSVIKMVPFFEYQVLLERIFAQNYYIVSVYSCLMRFRQFYFVTEIDDFSKAIAFAYTPFFIMFKMVSFFDYQVFFERIFAQNNYIVAVESFLIHFRQFYFVTQIDDFAKAIAFAYTPFFSIFKMVPFFE